MSEPISIAITGASRIAPLAGKQLEEFRRRDVVKNLFRELDRELKRTGGWPRGKRKRVRKRVDRLGEDGQYLALLRSYIEEPRGEVLATIREQISTRLRFEDPDITDASVLDVVMAAIERSAPKAHRDIRDVSFSNRQAVIDAVEAGNEDVKAHITRELSASEDARAEAGRARDDRLTELDRGVAPSGRLGTSGFTTDADPEKHLSVLAEKNQEAGRRLREIWEAGGVEGLLALLQTPEGWMASGGPAVWVALGRLVGQSGEFEAAERAFLTAAEQDEADPVRQVLRAASWARVRGDESRAAELIEQAVAMPGGDVHPAVRIAKAREIIDSPQQMLVMLEDIAPANSAERAGLETLRAQGHLLLGENEPAEAAVARALAADPGQLGARELKALMVLLGAQEQMLGGRRLDKEALRAAAKDFIELREALRPQKRFKESGYMTARAIQAFMLLGAPQELETAFEELEAGELSLDVASEIARSALGAQRADLVLRILAGQPRSQVVRMLAAVAEIHQGNDGDLGSAANELESFLESADAEDEDRGLAANALLGGSLSHQEIEWNQAAFEILEAEQPVPAAILEAEHLQAAGDHEGAEAALLKQGADATVLQRLAILAAENEEWPVALKRSKALETQNPNPGNTFNRAQILRQAGELKASEEKFMQLARNTSAEESLREQAFGKAAEVATERDDYSAALTITEEWIESTTDDIRAPWFKAFALARLSRYPEALDLIDTKKLKVESLEQAHLVATIYHRAASVVVALEKISELSNQFNRADETLEAMVLFTALRGTNKEALPPPLEERVKDGFNTFPTKFPNSKKIWTVEAPKTRNEFDAFAADLLADRHSVEEAAGNLESGSGPIAGLSAVTGRTVGETFLRLGVLPLGYGDPSLDELEKSDALEALGSGAVWDPSSVFVVGGLGREISAVVQNALPGSVLPQASLEDCDQGSSAADKRNDEITEIGYDNDRSAAWVNTWSAADSEREHLRAAGMLELAQKLQVIPDSDTESDGPWNQLLLAKPKTPPMLLTWPATIAVAERSAMPVFSDDRYVRLSARRTGLAAFGTVGLLWALFNRGLISETQYEQVSQAGFDGDSESRILSWGMEILPSHGTKEEVPR